MSKPAKSFLNSIWVKVGAVIATLLILIRVKGKYDSALAQNKISDLLIDDAKEEQKSKERMGKIKDLESKKKAPSKKRTPKEVEKHYNGRKK